MAKHPVAGISGVLGGLISSAPQASALAEQTPSPWPGRREEPSGAIGSTPSKVGVRLRQTAG